MKYRNIFIAALMLLGLGISCTDESTYPIDFDLVNNSNGGILSQVNVVSVAFDKFDIPNAFYEVVLEANDRDRGHLFTSVDLYVSYVDRNYAIPADPLDPDKSKAEVKIATFQASEFVADATTGLPRLTVTFTAPATLAALGLVEADLEGSDQFVFRQAMIFPDGNVFTSNNVNTAIASGGGVYKSPFQNVVPVICPSDLGGTISYSTINIIRAGGPAPTCIAPVTGTTTWTVGGPGFYKLGDASFGVFDCAYDDTPSVGVTLSDACNSLSIAGADQYTDTYTWTLISNDGTTLVIDWITTYPDGGRTSLTRTGGWPAGLVIP